MKPYDRLLLLYVARLCKHLMFPRLTVSKEELLYLNDTDNLDTLIAMVDGYKAAGDILGVTKSGK